MFWQSDLKKRPQLLMIELCTFSHIKRFAASLKNLWKQNLFYKQLEGRCD
jgi:hypothetical protein